MQIILPGGYRGSYLHAYDSNQSGEDQCPTPEVIDEPTTNCSKYEICCRETETDAKLRYSIGYLEA